MKSKGSIEQMLCHRFQVTKQPLSECYIFSDGFWGKRPVQLKLLADESKVGSVIHTNVVEDCGRVDLR